MTISSCASKPSAPPKPPRQRSSHVSAPRKRRPPLPKLPRPRPRPRKPPHGNPTVAGGGSGGGGNSGGGGGGGGPGQIIANPGGGSFQCPVNGSAYSNNYGPRGGGFHYGIDMFASSGTPLVAVKAGSVRYVPNEGAGGNTVYLSADDGNTYFYAHLSSFVGGARSVAQGEIVGLVGATGNASGPHLHFEIRLGGPNGSRINPYPTLQGAGC